MVNASPGLSGQVALVTGAARRIGRAIAEALGAAGVAVVVHYRASDNDAQALVEQLRADGHDAWRVRADLQDAGQASQLIARANDVCGRRVDILVNSASLFDTGRVMEFDALELEANIRINAFAPLLLCRGLAAQTTCGQVVNLLDARMNDYDREHAAYHLSKRMLQALTRMLALELAPDIRVNAVAPGLILPPPGEDERYLASLAHTVPLNRWGGAHDVVRAVMFLLQSPFVTGQIIYVDGGRNLRGYTCGG